MVAQPQAQLSTTPITAVVIARNEASRIGTTLGQLGFCSEILVIDNDSTDSTAEIARSMGAKVISQKATDFAYLRSLGLTHATHDWLLYIDADEVVSPELSEEVQAVISAPKHSAYALSRIDYFWGAPLHFGELYTARVNGIIRLVKRDAGSWEGAVHEVFIPHSSAGKLTNPLIHYAHDGIRDFLLTVNRYSTLRSEELFEKKIKSSYVRIALLPMCKFIYTYFIRMGFRDGARGFVYSFMMAFHSFLVGSKLYLAERGVKGQVGQYASPSNT